VGDVVRAIDGQTVSDGTSCKRAVAGRRSQNNGERQTIFTIDRNGEFLDLAVRPRLAGEGENSPGGHSPGYELIVYKVLQNSRGDGRPRQGRRVAQVDGYAESSVSRPLRIISAEPRPAALLVRVPASETEDRRAIDLEQLVVLDEGGRLRGSF